MKKFSGYLLSMLLVLIALAIADMAVFTFISIKTRGTNTILKVEAVSAAVTDTDSSFTIDENMEAKLDKYSAFAMIIGNDGEVIWEHKLPSELPTSYELKDIVSFTRWYLNDYPVYTWIRDDGILVLGLPKDSTWKYPVELSVSAVSSMFYALPYLIVTNVVILILLPILITRHWLKARERSRTEWIAGVSHDIRTPLSIVMGSVEKGSVAEKQCFKIRDLIGNLNTENKLDSGTGKWNEEQIEIAPLLREILCDYINTYEPDYTFNPEIDESLENFTINADRALIRRMIDNLITNSIVHNENGCEISVSLKPEGKGHVKLTVLDNGEGTDEAKIKALNKDLKNDYLPEHGLGIRVVKQVAKKYKYNVKFSSFPGKFFMSEIALR
ncbi:MAG: HAMP domain-containing histidine kinase [Lachnospiraceae bacterium]|nr:HAMP domain-containing histidine kinase [Lachnospiraceae bacterium]